MKLRDFVGEKTEENLIDCLTNVGNYVTCTGLGHRIKKITISSFISIYFFLFEITMNVTFSSTINSLNL